MLGVFELQVVLLLEVAHGESAPFLPFGGCRLRLAAIPGFTFLDHIHLPVPINIGVERYLQGFLVFGVRATLLLPAGSCLFFLHLLLDVLVQGFLLGRLHPRVVGECLDVFYLLDHRCQLDHLGFFGKLAESVLAGLELLFVLKVEVPAHGGSRRDLL